MKWRPGSQQTPFLATVAVFVLLYVVAALRYDNFLSPKVASDLVRENAVLGLTAIGMTFVILSGGIDLSVGAMVGFTSIAIAKLVTVLGLPPLAAFAAVLGFGAIYGALVGSLVWWFNLPSFLVTLAGMFLLRGLAFVVDLQSIAIQHPFYTAFDNFSYERIPLASLVFLATLMLAVYLANFTRFGRNVYALGGNHQSAVLMGIPAGATTLGIYTLSGFCAALAGVVASLNTAAGDAKAGPALELDAIAAVVIGGTLLTGGVGSLLGTFVGVLILGTIQTMITFEGTLSSWWTRIAIGALLLAFILLQRILQRRA